MASVIVRGDQCTAMLMHGRITSLLWICTSVSFRKINRALLSPCAKHFSSISLSLASCLFTPPFCSGTVTAPGHMFRNMGTNQQLAGTKRPRAGAASGADDPQPLMTPNWALRAVAYWGEMQFPLSLSSPILTDDGQLNVLKLPGLCFFFAPQIQYVEYPVVHLTLSSEGTPCDCILQQERKPCPIHGPFSCSCPAMHHVATMFQALLHELRSPRDAQFDVVVDEHPPFSHVFIDTRTHSWSFVLASLPVPDRRFGPIPLAQFDFPSAIRQNLNRFTVKLLNTVANPCAHCGTATDSRCAACNCLICGRCVQICGNCSGAVCHACSEYSDDDGRLLCHWCRS